MRLLQIKKWKNHNDSLRKQDRAVWLNHVVHETIDFGVALVVILYLLMLAALLVLSFMFPQL